MRLFRKKTETNLGQHGENIAAKTLKRAGMKILARNFLCPAGEADIIALDRSTRRELGAETIVVVEVKTRSSDLYVSPAGAVDSAKQKRLGKIANHYLTSRKAADQYALRFDIVSIVIRDGEKPIVEHILDAF